MASREPKMDDESASDSDVCADSSGRVTEPNPIPSALPFVREGAKVERDHLGRRLCGAKCRGKNKRCRRPGMLNGRCKPHDGLMPRECVLGDLEKDVRIRTRFSLAWGVGPADNASCRDGLAKAVLRPASLEVC
jgi:hypothetical protein